MNRLENIQSVTGNVTAVRTHDLVISDLEAAGPSILALPMRGFSTACRTGGLDYVRETIEAYGWDAASIRPPTPAPAAITAMDEVLTWISLIPQDRYVLRRIVGARALVNPVSDRHLFTWRKLGQALGAHHQAVLRWHGEGIALIVAALLAENKFDWGFQTLQKSATR